MIGVLATFKAQEGKAPELQRIFSALASQVRTNEPGNIAYVVTRPRGAANTYTVIELYDDEAAIAVHRAARHYLAAVPKIMALVDGRPTTEIVDSV